MNAKKLVELNSEGVERFAPDFSSGYVTTLEEMKELWGEIFLVEAGTGFVYQVQYNERLLEWLDEGEDELARVLVKIGKVFSPQQAAEAQSGVF